MDHLCSLDPRLASRLLTANSVITLTMIPSLDSILVASLGYLALSRRPALMVSKRTS